MNSPVRAQLGQHFEDMPRQMKLAARWLANHPTDVALLSMREQARMAGVPASTFSRLAKRLEFDGFESLKSVHARHVREQHAAFSSSTGRLRRRGCRQKDDDFISDHMTKLAHHLVAVTRAAAVGVTKEAAETNARAEKVFCLGLRASFPPAFMFHYVRSLLGGDSLLVEAAGGAGVDVLRALKKGDVLLVVSVAPYIRQTVDSVEFAARRQATIVAVTDSLLSPVAHPANSTVVVSFEFPSCLHSVTPAFVVIECLAALVASRRGEKGLETVADRERQIAAFGTYAKNSAKWNRPAA